MSEVKFGPDGGYVTVFCHYCGLASQEVPRPSEDKWDAIERLQGVNGQHERTHPEFKEPMTLPEIRASLDAHHAEEQKRHVAHGCTVNPCSCICGCQGEAGCSLEPQDLCWECELYSNRGRDEHGRKGFEVAENRAMRGERQE